MSGVVRDVHLVSSATAFGKAKRPLTEDALSLADYSEERTNLCAFVEAHQTIEAATHPNGEHNYTSQHQEKN